ncbi:MAG: hypothetical protein HQL66_10660 [Magnetococcales bacterium]|nr:hypothetical protein [Magnetococcales bacterium]
MSSEVVGTCWGCGSGLALIHLGYREVCPQCGRDTRVCRNCGHHDPGCYNECRETQAERVMEKDRATFCEFFHIRRTDKRKTPPNPALAARQAAEALFKKPS